MTLKIDLDVTLSGGAKVNLTSEQRQEVEKYVENLLFSGNVGRPRKYKRSYIKPLGSRIWMPDEDKSLLTEAVNSESSAKSRRHLNTILAQKFGRTPHAIDLRLHRLGFFKKSQKDIIGEAFEELRSQQAAA